MRRILLLEDRANRQKIFLPGGESDVERLSQLPYLDNVSSEGEVTQYLDKINAGDLSPLDDYSLLVFHRSAFKKAGINNLVAYGKEKGKPLIFFTGGVGDVIYRTTPYEDLILPSRMFYSALLFPFLERWKGEKNAPRLIELPYPDTWKVIYLLKLQSLAWRDGGVDKIQDRKALQEITSVLGSIDSYKELGELETAIKKQIIY